MKLMEWLNKLGILRWGTTAGVYRNAIERPYEMIDHNVFNADRDLVGGRDPREKKRTKCDKPHDDKPKA